MKNKFISLLEVRKLIALSFAIVFNILAVTGKIDANTYIIIFNVIIGFYFGKSTALDKPKDGE